MKDLSFKYTIVNKYHIYLFMLYHIKCTSAVKPLVGAYSYQCDIVVVVSHELQNI